MRTGTCQHLHVFIIIYIHVHVVIFCRLLFFINQQSFGGNRMLVKYIVWSFVQDYAIYFHLILIFLDCLLSKENSINSI